MPRRQARRRSAVRRQERDRLGFEAPKRAALRIDVHPANLDILPTGIIPQQTPDRPPLLPTPGMGCGRRGRRLTQTFRSLGDGTLTDANDHAVSIAGDARVCLAHDSALLGRQHQALRQHLADYSVKPLFDQFGKGSFPLGESQRADLELDDFQGYLLEAFKLRGRLTKLGYTASDR